MYNYNNPKFNIKNLFKLYKNKILYQKKHKINKKYKIYINLIIYILNNKINI